MRTLYTIILSIVPTMASAEVPPGSVQFLLDACKAETATIDKGFCYGVVSSTAQFTAAQCGGRQFAEMDLPMAADVPQEVTYGAMRQIFLNWAEANPTKWNKAMVVGVAEAFAESYPCRY